MVKNILLSLVLYCALSSYSLAQDTQLWTAFTTSGSVSEDSRFLLWFDGHTRYSDDIARLGVSIVRPGVGYKVNDNLSLWTGYAWVVSQASGRDDITDNRFWQQATYSLGKLGLGSFSGRTRFESRFVRSGGHAGFRLRQSYKWSRPITENWYSSLWNETFFALNDTDFGAETGYDQNRTHIGFGYKVSDNLKVEAGYLFNDIKRSSGSNLDNHNISLLLSAPF